jgi:hypothetical protein
LLREIEFAEDAKKLKQIYMYKIISSEDYNTEARLIKNEYRSGVMDPSREVAKIEKKRGNVYSKKK